jgi:hypothetical protein
MAEVVDAFERAFSAASLKGINAETWDRFIRTINVRLKGVEEKKADFEAAEQLLIGLGLQRINEALLPAFQTITGLSHLGAIFSTTSSTTLEIGVGSKELTIAEADRDRFAPSAYLAIRATGEGVRVMTGYLVEYQRETGTLKIDVDQFRGEGSHNDWTISAAAAPDFASFADIRGEAPEGLDTLEKIAQAIDNDPTFAETINSALASLNASLVNGLSGKVSLSRKIETSGLAQGGGTLASDRTILVPKANAASLRGGTDDTSALTAKAAYSAMAEVTLTDAATVTIDLTAGTDFYLPLGGNRTLANPTNADKVIGKKGRIRIVHSDRTLSFGSNWEFAGGEAPDLSEGSNKTDILYYDVIAADRILGALVPEIS